MTVPLAKELQKAAFSQLANQVESGNAAIDAFVEKHISAITTELLTECENSLNPSCVPNWKIRYCFGGKGLPHAAKQPIMKTLTNAGYNLDWDITEDVHTLIISWEEFR